MKKKIKKIQMFRLIVQLVLLVLSPALFILVFSGLQNIYEMITSDNFNFITAFPTLIEFITAIITTIVLGRFFCGWVCAFGTYNDLIHLLSKNVFKIDFKVNEKLDSALKYVKYLVLLLIVVVIWTMGSKVLESSSPWNAFTQITDFPQVLSHYTIGVILLLLITVGAFFIERFFCRYLCPLGAVFNIFSRIGILKINKPSDKCGKCRLCSNNCLMGLKLDKVESVCGGDCINCFKCIETCHRNNTKVNVLGENINPELASSLAIAAMVGLYAVNNLGGTALAQSGFATSSSNSVSTSINNDSQKYTDGTYTGIGTGFRGATTEMSVTIKDNIITNVETVSHGDTPRFYKGVESSMISGIMSAQSTKVDTISGSTYSCDGIINAVQDALDQAQISSSASAASSSNSDDSTTTNESAATDENSTTTDESNDSNAATSDGGSQFGNNGRDSNRHSKGGHDNEESATSSYDSKITMSEGSYTDGTYTGSGTGYKRGTTQMSVTIKNNVITNVTQVSNEDTPRFYENVESSIISDIISAQSTAVDTISGATYSCIGIIDAVQDALTKAKS